ncbi:hypothetical protein CJ030_MR5G009705 [Morella rubra]|uniref:Uncharacterized protein n=1 Tax=Morella rubra TaxID=262757 RepID=A0A6A1VIZ5_9ROSI|nr:hypothetical protein CJ030_MR5G009705 [Morella rubra]
MQMGWDPKSRAWLITDVLDAPRLVLQWSTGEKRKKEAILLKNEVKRKKRTNTHVRRTGDHEDEGCC